MEEKNNEVNMENVSDGYHTFKECPGKEQSKSVYYVSCEKFDRYGGKNVFEILGFKDISLEEETKNDYAIVTPIASERAFGLKLKTEEGWVEVNNGDFVFKDNEGNFSISNMPPITCKNCDGTMSIIKGVGENVLKNAYCSNPDNLSEFIKLKVPLDENFESTPMYCGFEMDVDEKVKDSSGELNENHLKEDSLNKNLFENKYKNWKVETDVTLPFETILLILKSGHVITRESWTDTVVFRQVPATIDANIVPKMQSLPDAAKTVIQSTGGISYDSQCLIYNTKTGVANSWCPTIEDIFANDWKVYTK